MAEGWTLEPVFPVQMLTLSFYDRGKLLDLSGHHFFLLYKTRIAIVPQGSCEDKQDDAGREVSVLVHVFSWETEQLPWSY